MNTQLNHTKSTPFLLNNSLNARKSSYPNYIKKDDVHSYNKYSTFSQGINYNSKFISTSVKANTMGSSTDHSAFFTKPGKFSSGVTLDLKHHPLDLKCEAQKCLDVIHNFKASLNTAQMNNYNINEQQDGRPSPGDVMNDVNKTITNVLSLLHFSDTSDISELLNELNNKMFPPPSDHIQHPDYPAIRSLTEKLIRVLCQCVEDSNYPEVMFDDTDEVEPSGQNLDIAGDMKLKTAERDQMNEALEQTLSTKADGVEFCLNYLKNLVKYYKEVKLYAQNRTSQIEQHAKKLSVLDKSHYNNLEIINNRKGTGSLGILSSQAVISFELDRLNQEFSDHSIKQYVIQVHNKVLNPINQFLRSELELKYQHFKESWVAEKRKLADAENSVKKSKEKYFQAGGSYYYFMHRQQKNDKDNKRIKELEDSKARLNETELIYKKDIEVANKVRKQNEVFKRSIYCATRILAMDSDDKLLELFGNFFKCQLDYYQPIPDCINTVLNKAKTVHPGDAFTKAVHEQRPLQKPPTDIKFEKYSSSQLVDPTTGKIVTQDDETPSELDSEAASKNRTAALKALKTHDLSKSLVPAKCRVCDRATVLTGVCCSRCDVTLHYKCLPYLIVICGQAEANKKEKTVCTTFGVSLEDHLRSTHQKIPYIVEKCISELESRGIDMHGLYRIAGVKHKVETLCGIFDSLSTKDLDLSDESPHLIASCLKLYFRQLPEPLFPFHLYDDFISQCKLWDEMMRNPNQNEAEEQKIKIISQLKTQFRKLPRSHYLIAQKLLKHLTVISNNSSLNKMDAHNLGIVFGPTLLRPVELGNTALAHINSRTKLIEIFINYPEIYDSEASDNGLVDRCDETKSDTEADISSSKSADLERLDEFDVFIKPPVSNIKRARSIKEIARVSGLGQLQLQSSPFARRKRSNKKHQLEINLKSPTLSTHRLAETKMPSLTPKMGKITLNNPLFDQVSTSSMESFDSPRKARLPSFGDNWVIPRDSANFSNDIIKACNALDLEDYLRQTKQEMTSVKFDNNDDDDTNIESVSSPSPSFVLTKNDSFASDPNIYNTLTSTSENDTMPVIRSLSADNTLDTRPIKLSTEELADNIPVESTITPFSIATAEDPAARTTPINSLRHSTSTESNSDYELDDADPEYCENKQFLRNIRKNYDPRPDSCSSDSSSTAKLNLSKSSKVLECEDSIMQLRNRLDCMITDCDNSENDEHSESSRCSSSNSSHYYTMDDTNLLSEEDIFAQKNGHKNNLANSDNYQKEALFSNSSTHKLSPKLTV